MSLDLPEHIKPVLIAIGESAARLPDKKYVRGQLASIEKLKDEAQAARYIQHLEDHILTIESVALDVLSHCQHLRSLCELPQQVTCPPKTDPRNELESDLKRKQVKAANYNYYARPGIWLSLEDSP